MINIPMWIRYDDTFGSNLMYNGGKVVEKVTNFKWCYVLEYVFNNVFLKLYYK